MEAGWVEEYKIVVPAITTAGVYYFTTDCGVHYEVRFGRRQDNILHATIVFGVINEEYEGEEYTVTNKGELYRVMTTIVHVVKMFMNEHPKMVTYEFTGLAKDDEPENKLTSRINLYRRYLPRIFENEWKFDYSRGNTIIVTRSK
ncbi:MAG: hypothetical protein H0W84_03655 [Bacteroidetes bacterium]|nr:hypothetical protein [Bacteroidota bacterium]